MKRTLYPSSRRDRRVFWASLFLAAFGAPVGLIAKDYWLLGASGLGLILGLVNVYILQDEPQGPRVDEYSVVIAQIVGIETQLSSLNAFLQRERKRVADTESTLAQLHGERARLEPLVITQRETVEAILSAHGARAASSAWKERVIGLILGVLASLIAAMVYSWLNR